MSHRATWSGAGPKIVVSDADSRSSGPAESAEVSDTGPAWCRAWSAVLEKGPDLCRPGAGRTVSRWSATRLARPVNADRRRASGVERTLTRTTRPSGDARPSRSERGAAPCPPAWSRCRPSAKVPGSCAAHFASRNSNMCTILLHWTDRNPTKQGNCGKPAHVPFAARSAWIMSKVQSRRLRPDHMISSPLTAALQENGANQGARPCPVGRDTPATRRPNRPLAVTAAAGVQGLPALRQAQGTSRPDLRTAWADGVSGSGRVTGSYQATEEISSGSRTPGVPETPRQVNACAR